MWPSVKFSLAVGASSSSVLSPEPEERVSWRYLITARCGLLPSSCGGLVTIPMPLASLLALRDALDCGDPLADAASAHGSASATIDVIRAAMEAAPASPLLFAELRALSAEDGGEVEVALVVLRSSVVSSRVPQMAPPVRVDPDSFSAFFSSELS